ALPPPKPPPADPAPNSETFPHHFLNYRDDLQHAVPIEAVIAGQVIQNERGQYFNFEARYPLAAPYGHLPLANLPSVPMQTIAAITGDDRWPGLTWRDVLFIDTETTGLEIAAGTVAFLIGVGYLDEADFVVRQVFMRDFNEEQALLQDLRALFRRFKAVASFNGKTFDLPMLENRFVLARLFSPLFDGPHLDLLHPARRMWRRRLENCKLATLEQEILDVSRTQADVPGYFIPSLYRKYLVDHDARPMAGIFYHNEMDIVSMAALTIALSQHLAGADDAHPVDLLSAGLWQQHLGRPARAEQSLRAALAAPLPPHLRPPALTGLAYLLKRQGRPAEAEPLWRELAAQTEYTAGNLTALEELAKYYEWQQKDFEAALRHIARALDSLRAWPPGPQKQQPLAAWEHRQARVQKKLRRNR
ncbi:MAG: ribonuclease H-like domain-containing protein, partial [Anaerolineae bacterium]